MTIEIRGDKKSYLLALLLLLLVGIGALWFWDHMSLKSELSQVIENSAGKDKIIQRWKDTAGAEHIVAEVRQVTLQELKKSNDASIQELRREIGNVKDLVSRVKMTATTSGSFAVPVHDTIIRVVNAEGDTVNLKERKFTFKDRWLTFDGMTHRDSIKASYRLTNSFTTDIKWKRPKWYKRKDLLMEIKSDNPNTTVGQVQTIVVSVPKLKWYESRPVVGAASFLLGYGVGRLH